MTTYELVIRPTNGFAALRLRELWEYRELFYFLVWRDIKVRYKQTVLGAAWAVVRPLISMIVFTFIFNRLAGFSSDRVPYQLFALTGTLAWTLFADGLSGSSQSLISNANLLTKVYFPRVIIPAAAVLRGLVDFGIAFVILLGAMLYYQYPPTHRMFLFPLVLIWGIATVLGVGLWFTAVGVKYRDIAHALPFITQLLFWITPVGYSASKVPVTMEFLYWLNPMTGVIEAFRYTLLGSAYLPPYLLSLSISLSLIVLVTGMLNFRRMEREFADVI